MNRCRKRGYVGVKREWRSVSGGKMVGAATRFRLESRIREPQSRFLNFVLILSFHFLPLQLSLIFVLILVSPLIPQFVLFILAFTFPLFTILSFVSSFPLPLFPFQNILFCLLHTFVLLYFVKIFYFTLLFHFLHNFTLLPLFSYFLFHF